uniref:Ribosomal protein S4 n=1 Tax=Schnabelia oligophylla TaxID=167919 RepID=A0A6M8EJK6_9LAMI|nr:ribosomal protein S4 [Schnabelia oligophylla]
MPALRFKRCRLLEGNVWNRELTIIQRRILKRLRKKKRSIHRRLYSIRNLHTYLKSQTTRKFSLFHGTPEMHRRRKQPYIPFLLNPERRLDVLLVRLHFRQSLPQARQPISHGKVCVNHRVVNILHFQVCHGDLISLKEDDARTLGKNIRRFFYIQISVEQIIGKSKNRPVRRWIRTKTKWYQNLKKSQWRQEIVQSRFLQELHSSRQEKVRVGRRSFDDEKILAIWNLLSARLEEQDHVEEKWTSPTLYYPTLSSFFSFFSVKADSRDNQGRCQHPIN